ncbi:MAG: hypothetical protein WA975_17815 [Mesorhizobium sp.]
MTALRAFAVTENEENTGAIYFAKHDIVAKKWGANEYADGDITYVSCRRAPWADAYVGQPIPAKVMIANGWHFECSGCGQRIDEDFFYDNRLPLEGVIGTQHSAVYCCSRCARKDLSLKRRRKAEEQRAIEAFKAIVRKRFPDADFCDDEQSSFKGHHAYVTAGRGGWHWKQVIVSFRFPGIKIGPAHYRLDGGYGIGPYFAGYSCCNGDREAFEVWAAKTKAAA